MDGMMNSNTLATITNLIQFRNKKALIRSNSSLKNQKIKIGGEPLGINSMELTLSSVTNNSKSLIGLEAAKWHQKQSQHLNFKSNSKGMILSLSMLIHPPNATLNHPNGNK